MGFSKYAHCAIVIVVELARHYKKKGISCKGISLKQSIPLNIIEEDVATLEQHTISTYSKANTGDTILFLAQPSRFIMTENIVSIFDKKPFYHALFDGRIMRFSPINIIKKNLNHKRKEINRYLSTCYLKIILQESIKIPNQIIVGFNRMLVA